MNKAAKIGVVLGVIIAICITIIVGTLQDWEFGEMYDLSAWKIMFCLAVIGGIVGGVIGSRFKDGKRDSATDK